MANKLQRAIRELELLEQGDPCSAPLSLIDPRATITVTAVYLLSLLSLPLTALADLLLFALYPIVMSAMCRRSYFALLRRSLVAIPFVLLVGMFNPFIDRVPALAVGNVIISRGWITLISLLMRGMLSVQAALVPAYAHGLRGICGALQRMGMPSLLTTLPMFIYRYLALLLRQAEEMDRARKARSFGRRSWPIGQWGDAVALLLVRSTERSELIHRAMLARGFNGQMEYLAPKRQLNRNDAAFITVWSVAIIALRFASPLSLLFHSSP